MLELPLPGDIPAWDHCAELVARWVSPIDGSQSAPPRDALIEIAQIMTSAYSEGEETLLWWLDRAGVLQSSE